MPRSRSRRPATRASRPVAAAALAALLVVACGGSASPSPSPEASGSPDPSADSGLGFRLRATYVQALPPVELFPLTPVVLITDDLVAVQQGPIPLIFPGPLVNPLVGMQLTDEAWAEIVAEARNAGLLGGETDFTGGMMPPGSQSGLLQIVVDGQLVELTGDPSRVAFCGDTYCQAEPGTPGAFAVFWNLLSDLARLTDGGVGPQGEYVPDAWAAIVGPPPADAEGLAGAPLQWPFDVPAAEFGRALSGDADRRCGTVSGADAATFGAALGNATQLTRWLDPSSAIEVGLTVRPVLPGDGDPCDPIVGG